MKTKFTNKLKIAAFSIAMLAAGTAMNAQSVPGTSADVGRETAAAAFGSDEGYVRVVDNKGTIKYLQSNNGVTMFTDTAPNGGIVTTWQLGGVLTEDTYIDASGQSFVIDGIANVTDTEIAALVSANIVDGSIANPNDPANTAAATAPGTGFAFLVRDEETGETKKLNIADLINSEAAEFTVTATEASVSNAGTAGSNTVTLTLGLAAVDVNRIQVYRNGVKLRGTRGNIAGLPGATAADYSISADGLTLTVTPPNTDWAFYEGDIIEYYYAK